MTTRDDLVGKISEHSLKFYNGTLKWNTEGFEDENGQYHKWDDPDVNPPTPLPPAPMSDFGGISSDSAYGKIEASRRVHQPLAFSYVGLRGGGGEGQGIDFSSSPLARRARNVLGATFSPLCVSHDETDDVGGKTMHKTVPREGLFLDVEDEITRARLLGRLEGLLISRWYPEYTDNLEQAYKMVKVEYPDAIVEAVLGSARDPSGQSGEAASDSGAGMSAAHKPPKPATTADSGAGSRDISTWGAGEPATSPFSDISGMTDVSDPPSELIDPIFNEATMAKKKTDSIGLAPMHITSGHTVAALVPLIKGKGKERAVDIPEDQDESGLSAGKTPAARQMNDEDYDDEAEDTSEENKIKRKREGGREPGNEYLGEDIGPGSSTKHPNNPTYPNKDRKDSKWDDTVSKEPSVAADVAEEEEEIPNSVEQPEPEAPTAKARAKATGKNRKKSTTKAPTSRRSSRLAAAETKEKEG